MSLCTDVAEIWYVYRPDESCGGQVRFSQSARITLPISQSAALFVATPSGVYIDSNLPIFIDAPHVFILLHPTNCLTYTRKSDTSRYSVSSFVIFMLLKLKLISGKAGVRARERVWFNC